MNKMIDFAEHTRTTRYFRDYAIEEIKIAYRIMEYLAPDACFPPCTNEDTKELMLFGKYSDAYDHIVDNVGEEINFVDLGCSSGNELLRKNAIELMEYLVPIYRKSVTDAKEQRKLNLIAELQELNNEP